MKNYLETLFAKIGGTSHLRFLIGAAIAFLTFAIPAVIGFWWYVSLPLSVVVTAAVTINYRRRATKKPEAKDILSMLLGALLVWVIVIVVRLITM